MSELQTNEQNKKDSLEPETQNQENQKKKILINLTKKRNQKNRKIKKQELQNQQDFDPYSFFKLSIDEPSGDNGNKNGKKPSRFPFLTTITLTLLALGFINLFMMPKPDNTIPFSQFRKLVEDGEIVRVEMGESTFTGYGPEFSKTDSADSQTVDSEKMKIQSCRIFSFCVSVLKKKLQTEMFTERPAF